MSRSRRALLVTGLSGLSGLLAACASVPLPAGDARSPGLLDRPPPTGGRLWQLDPAASRLRALSFRAGALTRVGHHHILQAGEARGLLWLPTQGLAGAQAELAIPLADLQIDEPSWRAEAGGEFDERALSAEERAATKRNLLRSLQADRHPELRLRLLNLVGAAPWWAAELLAELAGRPFRQRVALRVQAAGDLLQIDGRLVLRHADHGLAPFSVLGGLLAVAEEIVIDAALAWRRVNA